jgi:hypothetical protein
MMINIGTVCPTLTVIIVHGVLSKKVAGSAAFVGMLISVKQLTVVNADID